LGYRGGLQPRFVLAAGDELIMDVYLDPDPIELEPIVARAERIRRELERQGFFRRRELRNGFFLTPAQLRTRPPVTEAELLGRSPFVEVHRGWNGSRISMRSAGRECEPKLFVDNIEIRPNSSRQDHVTVEDHVNFADIIALEVYRGYAEIPHELSTGWENTCGLIMVWTKWSELRSGGGGGGCP
jgi:hypothetical protein